MKNDLRDSSYDYFDTDYDFYQEVWVETNEAKQLVVKHTECPVN